MYPTVPIGGPTGSTPGTSALTDDSLLCRAVLWIYGDGPRPCDDTMCIDTMCPEDTRHSACVWQDMRRLCVESLGYATPLTPPPTITLSYSFVPPNVTTVLASAGRG